MVQEQPEWRQRGSREHASCPAESGKCPAWIARPGYLISSESSWLAARTGSGNPFACIRIRIRIVLDVCLHTYHTYVHKVPEVIYICTCTCTSSGYPALRSSTAAWSSYWQLLVQAGTETACMMVCGNVLAMHLPNVPDCAVCNHRQGQPSPPVNMKATTQTGASLDTSGAGSTRAVHEKTAIPLRTIAWHCAMSPSTGAAFTLRAIAAERAISALRVRPE